MRLPPDVELLESLLWEPGSGYFLLDLHVERLCASAGSLGVDVAAADVRAALAAHACGLATPRKVRLLVAVDGALKIDDEPPRPSVPVRAALAIAPVDRADWRLRHKTTARAPYVEALAAVRPLGADDVILWNADGELTETATANLVLRLDGVDCTPPLQCGLLAGTYRAQLLHEGALVERVLRREDLARAEAVALVNSVRRHCAIELVADHGRS